MEKCPKCGSQNTAVYVWGMQPLDAELTAGLKNGTVKLGGSCISYPCPLKHCNNCGADFSFTDDLDAPAEK